MPSIGETLREARMRQRLDITDVEARTKIRAKYLRALENEDFGMLPGSTFVKSFLRTYAEFLGLDPHLLVEEYRARHEPVTEGELTPFPSRSPAGRDRRPPPRRFGPLFGIAAFVFGVLVLLLVLGLTGGSDEKAKRSDNPSSQQRTTTSNTSTTKKKASKKRSKRRTPTVVRMRISPQAPTYACVDDGRGKVLYEGTLTKARSFRSKRVRLNLGRRVVRLTVNGKRVRIPEGSDPIGYSFTPRSTRTLPLGQRPCA